MRPWAYKLAQGCGAPCKDDIFGFFPAVFANLNTVRGSRMALGGVLLEEP